MNLIGAQIIADKLMLTYVLEKRINEYDVEYRDAAVAIDINSFKLISFIKEHIVEPND